jgi:hypothetical protein
MRRWRVGDVVVSAGPTAGRLVRDGGADRLDV